MATTATHCSHYDQDRIWGLLHHPKAHRWFEGLTELRKAVALRVAVQCMTEVRLKLAKQKVSEGRVPPKGYQVPACNHLQMNEAQSALT